MWKRCKVLGLFNIQEKDHIIVKEEAGNLCRTEIDVATVELNESNFSSSFSSSFSDTGQNG